MKKVKQNELLSDIISAHKELEIAKQNYRYAINDKLIEMYAHKIIAARFRCDYLIEKAKASGLTFSPVPDNLFQRFQR
ncbi:MAG: DUF2508 family protein [Clostridia bacterium]|nr:DUF2508 family protein [Clostridia bacterium]